MKCSALLLLCSTAYADVVVVGNGRTDRDVIVDAAAIPDTLAPGDLEAVRQRLMNLHLFESVEVTGDQQHLTIRVHEKWTLFPIPYFSSSSRGQSGGVALLESNLFGRNKLIAIGGSYSSWGGAGYAFFSVRSKARARP